MKEFQGKVAVVTVSPTQAEPWWGNYKSVSEKAPFWGPFLLAS
jgi:hypothetical protein